MKNTWQRKERSKRERCKRQNIRSIYAVVLRRPLTGVGIISSISNNEIERMKTSS
jgi:hypothetical protein